MLGAGDFLFFKVLKGFESVRVLDIMSVSEWIEEEPYRIWGDFK